MFSSRTVHIADSSYIEGIPCNLHQTSCNKETTEASGNWTADSKNQNKRKPFVSGDWEIKNLNISMTTCGSKISIQGTGWRVYVFVWWINLHFSNEPLGVSWCCDTYLPNSNIHKYLVQCWPMRCVLVDWLITKLSHLRSFSNCRCVRSVVPTQIHHHQSITVTVIFPVFIKQSVCLTGGVFWEERDGEKKWTAAQNPSTENIIFSATLDCNNKRSDCSEPVSEQEVLKRSQIVLSE